MSGLLVPTSMAATNVDSFNRSFVHTVDIANFTPMASDARSTEYGEDEVFTVVAPAAGDHVWIAFEAEVVNTVTPNGNVYRNIDPDARNFINPAGTVFSGFLPKVGDLIRFGGADVALVPDRTTETYLNVDPGNMAYVWASAPATDTLSMKLVEETYISIGEGSLGSLQRIDGYVFDVVNN